MKTCLNRLGLILAAAVLLPAISAKAAPSNSAPAKPAAAKSVATTNAAPEEVVIPKSVFRDDLEMGKDPFFPKSTRRSQKIPALVKTVVAPITQLSLKGISGPAGNRLALINNQPIAVGETATVRIPSGQIKVHCWEISENSVLVSVEGDPEKKELRLHDSL